MRFNVACAAALSAAGIASALPGWLNNQVNVYDDDKPTVPGENPLTYCNADRNDDIITIDHVNLSPNPPAAYVNLPLKHR